MNSVFYIVFSKVLLSHMFVYNFLNVYLLTVTHGPKAFLMRFNHLNFYRFFLPRVNRNFIFILKNGGIISVTLAFLFAATMTASESNLWL